MFTRVEARRFRSLKAVEQDVGPFRALVGPSGSGKTTFLDVMALLGEARARRRAHFDGTQRDFALYMEARINEASLRSPCAKSAA